MQESYLYANSSAVALSSKLLTHEKILRLAECDSVEEGFKLLLEAGFADGKALTVKNFEEALKNRLDEAFDLVLKNSPEPNSTNCFLLINDYRNAKTVMKCKYSRKEVPLLSNGIFDAEKLKEKLLNDDYSDFPEEMSQALAEIDEQFYLGNRKPAVIDVALDKAYYKNVFRLLKKSKSETIKNYFTAEVDMKNILDFFRVKKAGLGQDYFFNIFVEGASLDKDFFTSLFAADDENFLIKFSGTAYVDFVKLLSEEIKEGKAFSKSEVFCLDYKKKLLSNSKNNLEGIEPLVNYFLAANTETENVRLIFVCLKNGVDKQQILKRLRESYE